MTKKEKVPAPPKEKGAVCSHCMGDRAECGCREKGEGTPMPWVII